MNLKINLGGHGLGMLNKEFFSSNQRTNMTTLKDLRNNLGNQCYLDDKIKECFKNGQLEVLKQFVILYPKFAWSQFYLKYHDIVTSDNLFEFLEGPLRPIFERNKQIRGHVIQVIVCELDVNKLTAKQFLLLQKENLIERNGRPIGLSLYESIDYFMHYGITNWLLDSIEKYPERNWYFPTGFYGSEVPAKKLFPYLKNTTRVHRCYMIRAEKYVMLQEFLLENGLLEKCQHQFIQGPMIHELLDLKYPGMTRYEQYQKVYDMMNTYTNFFHLVKQIGTEEEVFDYLSKFKRNDLMKILGHMLPTEEKYLDYVMDRMIITNICVRVDVVYKDDMDKIKSNIRYIAKRIPWISLMMRKSINYHEDMNEDELEVNKRREIIAEKEFIVKEEPKEELSRQTWGQYFSSWMGYK